MAHLRGGTGLKIPGFSGILVQNGQIYGPQRGAVPILAKSSTFWPKCAILPQIGGFALPGLDSFGPGPVIK